MEFLKRKFPLIFNKKIGFLSKKNSTFLLLVLTLIIILSPSSVELKWIALSLSMFSTMTNDSIQTIGTFLSANSKTKWWKMWIYIGSLFIITMLVAWFGFNHELDFRRLHDIPYDPQVNLMHFAAPILLIILTCNKIPVSTTFLILSVFSTQDVLGFILIKTLYSYILAFVSSFILWSFLQKYFAKIFKDKDKNEIEIKGWLIFQWFSSGVLWVSWLSQNTSNMVVYIPREISIYSLILFIGLGIAMIGFNIYNRGGPIQEIVDEKTDIANIYSTSIINLSYAAIILTMTYTSTIPIATTWTFIGVLGGRELSIARYKESQALNFRDRYKSTIRNILKDLTLAGSGIVISLLFYVIVILYN